MNPDLVSVVVLSFCRPDLLTRALAGLRAQTYAPLDVIVVDNRSSRSDEVLRLLRDHPDFRLLALAKNTGFTGGMNAGVQAARGKYILLTEDDVILEPDCIRNLVQELARLPRESLLSGILLNFGEGTVLYSGGSVRLGRDLRLDLPGHGRLDHGEQDEPMRTGFIPGCFVFGTADYLRQLGPFRDDFFLYQEDVDLSLRVLEQGNELWVVPSARCSHQPPSRPWTDPDIEFHKLKNSLAICATRKTSDCA